MWKENQKSMNENQQRKSTQCTRSRTHTPKLKAIACNIKQSKVNESCSSAFNHARARDARGPKNENVHREKNNQRRRLTRCRIKPQNLWLFLVFRQQCNTHGQVKHFVWVNLLIIAKRCAGQREKESARVKKSTANQDETNEEPL